MAKNLESEIQSINKNLLNICAKVERNFIKSMYALTHYSQKDAEEVKAADIEVDALEVEFEEACLRVLATQQPVARDLRYLFAVLKVNNDIERIGDLAVNIAERTISLLKAGNSKPADIEAIFPISDMFQKTLQMLKTCFDALTDFDVEKAQRARKLDREINEMNRAFYKMFLSIVKDEPKSIETMLCYSSITKYLERIGDYITNIAEDIIYAEKGKIIRHEKKLQEAAK